MHFDWGRVGQVPYVLWHLSGDGDVVGVLEFARWSVVFCGVVFFLFFGVAEEARRHYSEAWNWVARKVGMICGRGGRNDFDTYVEFGTRSPFSFRSDS